MDRRFFASPLLGLKKTDGCYNGWYQPLEWDAQRRMTFSGVSLPDQPLRWMIR